MNAFWNWMKFHWREILKTTVKFIVFYSVFATLYLIFFGAHYWLLTTTRAFVEPLIVFISYIMLLIASASIASAVTKIVFMKFEPVVIFDDKIRKKKHSVR